MKILLNIISLGFLFAAIIALYIFLGFDFASDEHVPLKELVRISIVVELFVISIATAIASKKASKNFN